MSLCVSKDISRWLMRSYVVAKCLPWPYWVLTRYLVCMVLVLAVIASVLQGGWVVSIDCQGVARWMRVVASMLWSVYSSVDMWLL